MSYENDKRILRELGKRYMAYANDPVNLARKKLWSDFNDGTMTRPMVTISQECFHELNTDGFLTLQCEDPLLRAVEEELRTNIYKWENHPADLVLAPYFSFPKAVTNSGYGVPIVEKTAETDSSNNVVSHDYVNQFETEDDLEKIKPMHITHDVAETRRRQELMEDIFSDIGPVKGLGIKFRLGVWDAIAQRMSVEDIYYLLMDEPEFLHQIVSGFTESVISGIKEANELEVCESKLQQCHCSYVFDSEFDTPCKDITYNSWGYGMAQLFTSVSPHITEEFEIPYITKLAGYFKNIYYGCCEKLSDRMELVTKIPNLRKLSCSPWSDPDLFADQLPKDIIMSYKPNPAFLAGDTFDEEAVRKNLRQAIDAAKRNNLRLEMLLKDISTVRYEPQRLARWNAIAMEEVNR